MTYITTIISIQLFIQQRLYKQVNRDKLIAHINKYGIDVNTYYANMINSSATEEWYILEELKSCDIWEVSK